MKISDLLETTRGQKGRITVEDVFGDFGFRVVWCSWRHYTDVWVFECISHLSEQDGGFLGVAKEGAKSSDEIVWLTSNDLTLLEDCEEYLSAYMRWDGCAQIGFGSHYWAGPKDYLTHSVLMKYLYNRSIELMRSLEDEEGWPENEWPEDDPTPAVIPKPVDFTLP